MKRIRRILWLLGILMVLALAGCSGVSEPVSIDTTLTVDTSFDGSRVMTAEIPSSVFRFAFGRDIEKLESVISDYAPDDMYCVARESEDGGAVIEMHIDFASRNEYQRKIESICSGNDSENAVSPSIIFDYSRSVLKNGYTIEENFTSLDLFWWLSDALSEEYSAFSGRDITEIFELGTTVVDFNGESALMDDYIQISTTESDAFDSIEISAVLYDDETVSAEIKYVVKNRIVASLGDRLDVLMNGIVPEGALLSYQDGDSFRTYILEIEQESYYSYIQDVNKALRTSGTEFEVNREGAGDSLGGRMTVTQYYDGSYFLNLTDEGTDMIYSLTVPSDYTVESCTGTYGYLKSDVSQYSGDQCIISMTVSSSDEVVTVLGYAVDIDEVSVSTTINSDTSIERDIVFRLSSEADEIVGASILERLEAAAEQINDAERISVNTEQLISSSQYRISMSARSPEEMTEMTDAVLGVSADDTGSVSALTGGIRNKRNPLRIVSSYEDSLNFSEFLRGSQVTGGIHYSLTYPRGYNASFTEDNVYEDAAAEGSTVSCSTFNKLLTVKSSASRINTEGVIIVAIWALSIVCILVILIINYKTVIRLITKHRLDIESSLFSGKYLAMLTIITVAVVCFAFMSIRLIFRIY